MCLKCPEMFLGVVAVGEGGSGVLAGVGEQGAGCTSVMLLSTPQCKAARPLTLPLLSKPGHPGSPQTPSQVPAHPHPISFSLVPSGQPSSSRTNWMM